jgi:opacity protein-like surface antigen
MRMLFIAATLALAGATTAQAADNGFYLGAGVSQAKLDNVGQDFDTGDLDEFEIDETAFKIIAGFRPLDKLAVEFNYMDLGSASEDVGGVQFEADAKAYGAYVVGLLPIALIDLYAKAGLVHWETEASAGDIFDIDDDGTEFAYGAGAQVRLGSLAARLEYEQFDVENTDGVELLSLGLTWTFL